MKSYIKRFLLITICLFSLGATFAQYDTIPPYKKSVYFPAVRLLLPDSVSYFTKSNFDKKSSVMVMLFNPQCEHCQHETSELVKHIDKFKGTEILMVTSMPYDSMMNFRERYQLAKYDNIIVAQDANFTLISFFSIHALPTLAFYNRNKEFTGIFEGGLPIDKIEKELEKAGK